MGFLKPLTGLHINPKHDNLNLKIFLLRRRGGSKLHKSFGMCGLICLWKAFTAPCIPSSDSMAFASSTAFFLTWQIHEFSSCRSSITVNCTCYKPFRSHTKKNICMEHSYKCLNVLTFNKDAHMVSHFIQKLSETYRRVQHKLNSTDKLVQSEVVYWNRCWSYTLLMHAIAPKGLISEKGDDCCWALWTQQCKGSENCSIYSYQMELM